MKNIFSKADVVLFVCVIAIAAAGIALMLDTGDAQTAVIRKDGVFLRQIRLNTDQDFWVDDVHIEVRGGAIRFAESDCAGQECVHAGFMRRPGSSMACLPNRVSISVLGLSEVDAVAE